MISKKFFSSSKSFYNALFNGEIKYTSEDIELHDKSKEEILGKELKSLYEKFCYLNGYLGKLISKIILYI
jgi:hypothetical protein